MEYKGYTATVEFDETVDAFHGRVDDIVDVVTFEADSVKNLHREFQASVDDYLEMCAERGKEPQRPFSGKFVVRIPPEMHRGAIVTARRAGESLNAWVERAIAEALQSSMYEIGNPAAKAGDTAISSISSDQRDVYGRLPMGSVFHKGGSSSRMVHGNRVGEGKHSSQSEARMAGKKNEQTSSKVAKVAGKVLSTGKATPKQAKTLAASALTQSANKPKAGKKK